MPVRLLRPGITDSDRWNACDWQAQSLYIRLLTLVDDFGRYDGRIQLIHSHAYSMRPDVTIEQTERDCQQLADNGLLVFYKVGGKPYAQLTNWQERVRSKAKYPAPPDNNCQQPAVNLPATCQQPDSNCPPPTPCALRPAPTPSPIDGQNLPVELPHGFPKTEADAAERAKMVGVPDEEWVKTAWSQAVGRGGRDSKDVLIRSFQHWIKSVWEYERERRAKAKNGTRLNNSGSGTPNRNNNLNATALDQYDGV